MASAETLEALAQTVENNLAHQHDWKDVQIHHRADLPRPIITGQPPQRLYVHPDEQVEIIKAEKEQQTRLPQPPEVEWVLPVHLSEKWTINQLASVFDALESVPSVGNADLGIVEDEHKSSAWMKWRGRGRGKRVTLAIVQDDSTVVYYIVHEGTVKPRQN